MPCMFRRKTPNTLQMEEFFLCKDSSKVIVIKIIVKLRDSGCLTVKVKRFRKARE